MGALRVGDIVTRRSYGEDLLFRIVNITRDENGIERYSLRGMSTRITADSISEDLLIQNSRTAYARVQMELTRMNRSLKSDTGIRKLLYRIKKKPGKILQIDSSEDFLKRCLNYYKESSIDCIGKWVSENRQPEIVEQYIRSYKPDILIITGHDGIKKNCKNINSIDSYATSGFYINSVKLARNIEPDPEKLFIFAGACQSYYEAIMQAGANYASSPKRVLINALDPGIVAQKFAITDSETTLVPRDVVPLTITGSDGIGGKATKGRMK